MIPSIVLLALLLVLVAQQDAEHRPVEMTSRGGLSIDLKKKIGIAKGDVLIKRDDVLVCCDEAEARYLANKIERVTCKGRVVIVRPDGTRATAGLAVFLASEDKVTLSGSAHVITEAADLQGERIVYDIKNDRLEVEGDKSRFKYTPITPGQPITPKDPKDPLERTCPPGQKK
jgi:lipopolysaccharide transport protein LptA